MAIGAQRDQQFDPVVARHAMMDFEVTTCRLDLCSRAETASTPMTVTSEGFSAVPAALCAPMVGPVGSFVALTMGRVGR